MDFLALLLTFLLSVTVTPAVKKLAIYFGAIDQPSERKIHEKTMPRLGGLAIFLSFLIGFFVFIPETFEAWPIMVGAFIMLITGILDDLYELSAKSKLIGQLFAAGITVYGGITIEFITIPLGEKLEFGYLEVPITIVWIVAITNAINLIDGLDGLAAGVTSIALIAIIGLSVSMGNSQITLIGLILLGSTLGFLVHNFHPAKIFMGDTGSLFLGYMISVIAVMGLYKNATVFSLFVPIIILGIPILDTLFAIIRRIIHKKPLSAPDKFHLHHCIIGMGFTHRQTVIMIYALSSLFSIAAILFNKSTIWGSIIIIVALLIFVEIVVEITGLISKDYRPILNWMKGNEARK